MPNAGSSSQVKSYSLAHAVPGTTGTGLDQFPEYVFGDNGLAGATDGRDIVKGAAAANSLNQLIVEAANATGASTDGQFTVDEVIAMNQYIRANHLTEWTALHGDDEGGEETGFHYVQNDGSTTPYRGQNFVNTVADGVYHLGFEIQDGRFLNEDGDANASVQQVAEWLTQFFTDHSTTNTGLDTVTNLIMADAGLDARISDAEIASGADAADGMNHIIADAIAATGVAADHDISAADVAALNAYIRADAGRIAEWTALHGDDENGTETGFHLVQNDGANTKFFGQNLVNTVADGIYHLGFEIENGRLLNEDGDANATLSDVADWLTYFNVDQSTTGTGLDRIVDVIKSDRGLSKYTNAGDINGGAKAADELNHIIVDAIQSTNANADGWITAEDLRQMNADIQGDAELLARWTELHGDDEGGEETGFHLVQNDGANTQYFGKNLVNTVADGIYHLGFEIQGDRFLNEDGNANATLNDVASWLNVFYNEAVLINDNGGSNTIQGSDDKEQINGNCGNDTINAAAGNDLVYGGSGNDTIDGGAGNDLIYGGSGNDTLAGGEGDDTFRVLGNKAKGFEGYDTYNGGSGNDVIAAVGDQVDIGMTQFSAADSIEVIDATGATNGVRLMGDWKANTLDFSGTQLAGNITINGGGGNDTIIGSNGNDVIEGGGWGNQTIFGGAGDDIIHADKGNDTVDGGAGNDTFRVSGSKSSNFEGWDSYTGGEGQDMLEMTGENVDVGLTEFSAANGIEVIDASGVGGQARILGDWNANTFDFSATSLVGNITINGGGGNDTIIGSAGNDIIEGGGWGNQSIFGGAGDDVIYGDKGNDTMDGGAGNDTFRVSGNKCSNFEGWDSYTGGEGTDSIVAFGDRVDLGLTSFGAANGIEVIDFSALTGEGRILGDWNGNTLDFSTTTLVGHVVIDGGGGNDTINGSAGDEVIRGDTGNDVLNGGRGNDLIYGGSGRDVFVFEQNWGRDTVADYRDNYDRLDMRNSGATDFSSLNLSQDGLDTVISFGSDSIVLMGVNSASINQADFMFA
ncbi:MAG: hypothetical protein H6943_07945 [Zoogloeaceae bacterium]|nr:hypothetical protein [Zoogloeaceae bacterium]